MVEDNIFTCPDCGSINFAALRHFRDQAHNLRELEAMLSRIQQELELPDIEVTYFVTPNGSHFRRPDCGWIEDIPLEKVTEFYSHEEAVEADYKPCKTCRS